MDTLKVYHYLQKNKSNYILKKLCDTIIPQYYPLEYMRPGCRMAFKFLRGSSVLHAGLPQPQPFKYFALNAVGYLEKLHSFLAPH
jgi:hypothetical protein